MINLIELLIKLNFAKDEKRAKSMIDGGNVSLGGMFRTDQNQIVPYELKIAKKQYEIEKRHMLKFNVIQVGEKYKQFKGVQI